jgi:cyclopropane-fatty-acyl-phospholipid synthase
MGAIVYRDRLQGVFDALEFDRPFQVVLPDGSAATHGQAPYAFTIHIKTGRAARDIVTKSSLGFGEAYTRGEVDVDGDLQDVALLSYELQERLLKGSLWERVRYVLGFFARRNTLGGSKKNIAAHYDLANSFYQLWLDAEMQYTCAYFDQPTDTLEDAQRQKMDLVCRKLRLQPGELVVEAGCGWGGLALHMARNYGVRVKSFNISKEQIEYARAKATRLGIDNERIEYVHDDYRNIPNHVKSCDKFASICMLEHVGRESYAAFHQLVGKVLRKPGLAMLQFISRTNPSPISNPWLEKYVFPGYYNPSLGEIIKPLEAEHRQLHLVDVENMRYHYALTLQHWLERFEHNADKIRAQWGEAVVRTFRLYLNGGLADFAHGAGTLVYQVLLSHGFDNNAPLTRHHFYAEAEAETKPQAARIRALEPA